MGGLKDKFGGDLREALKAHDDFKVSVLRMVQASLHNKEIEKREKNGDGALTDDEEIAVLRTEIKRRKEASTEFAKGGRQDLSEKESREADLLSAYAPRELDDAVLSAVIDEVVRSEGSDPKQFGKIMGLVMKRVAGNASGDRVSALLKKAIGA